MRILKKTLGRLGINVQDFTGDDFAATPFGDLPTTREPWNPTADSEPDILDGILGPDGDNWDAMKMAHLTVAALDETSSKPFCSIRRS